MRRFAFLLLLVAASATTVSVNSSHYYAEFPRDPAVNFTVDSLGCTSRIGLRHLTQSECATIRVSGGLDVISGLAFPGGPWTSTSSPPSFWPVSNEVSRQAGCSTSNINTNGWGMYYNELTTGNTVDRSQLDHMYMQICFANDAIPLSELHRRPVATANSNFTLSDVRMQCPQGSEPVLNAEDCLTYVAQSPQFTFQMANPSSSPYQPDGCLHYTGNHAGPNNGIANTANLWYNAWHQVTARRANISSLVPEANQANFRVICRLVDELSNSAGTTSVSVFLGLLALVVHAVV